jgi:Spy/CpxP family protein refolding chaperone
MCGFLFGALALLAVFKIAKYARYGCGGWRGGWRHRHHGGRGGGWMRWLFEDLETTPSQERNIRESLDSLREHARETKEEFKKSVADLAEALSADDFDHEKVGEAWVKQDKALETIRMAAIDALGKIHGTLDDTQRARLADIIRRRF